MNTTWMPEEEFVNPLLFIFDEVLPSMNTMASLTLAAAVARKAPRSTMKGVKGDVFGEMVEVASNFIN